MNFSFSVTRSGIKLDISRYNWNEETRIFSTNENDDNLVLDFRNWDGVIFRTGNSCIFKTGDYCIFDTGSNCTFDTFSSCTFRTGPYCTFHTGSDCTFHTGSDCTFLTGSNCVAIRYDVNGIIYIPDEKIIKLNGDGIPGFTIIEPPKTKHKIMIDGKEIEISEESFNALKKSLIES